MSVHTLTKPEKTEALIPEVGLHLDIPSHEYHAINAVSSHRLSLLKRSPAHLLHEILFPTPQTEAMKLGEAVHCAILEPDLFPDRYCPAPKVDRRTKAGKEIYENFLQENVGRVVLKHDEFLSCCAMSGKVNGHSVASKLIDRADMKEVSGFFNDPVTGLFCRMRADAICKSIGTIVDLKTTQNASPSEFERSIFKFGYHRQGAFYIDAAQVLGLKIDHYAIIAVESEAPHCVAVYRLKNDVIELGRRENIALMEVWKKCADADEWPAYPELVTDIGIPAWAKNQTEKELL